MYLELRNLTDRVDQMGELTKDGLVLLALSIIAERLDVIAKCVEEKTDAMGLMDSYFKTLPCGLGRK